jgi:Na+/glutamate symporter
MPMMIERQICNQLGIVKIEIKIYGVIRSENITNVFIQSFQFPDFEIFFFVEIIINSFIQSFKKKVSNLSG